MGFATIEQAAAQAYDTWFGGADKAACMLRGYSAAHFKAHPSQKVEQIAVQHRPKRQNGSASWEGDFELTVGFKLRGQKDWYSAVAYCKGGDIGMPCSVEADGGAFNLAPANGGRSSLTLSTDRLTIEGGRGFAMIGKGQDRFFTLPRSPRAECDRVFKSGKR